MLNLQSTLKNNDVIKPKNFCSSENTVNMVKRHLTEMVENICKLYIGKGVNIQNI